MKLSPQPGPIARSLAWLLRVALVLQVWGAAAKFLFIEYETETPLFGLLAFDWGWPEARVLQIDDASVWLNFGCGIAVLVLALLAAGWSRASGARSPLDQWMIVWQTPLLLVPFLWELATVVAGFIRLEGFLPAALLTSGTMLEPIERWAISDFASHAVRYGIPIALFLLTPMPGTPEIATRRFNIAMWVVRIAAALTFIGHGLKAIYLNPIFVDYILVASNKLLGYELSQGAAENLLQVIGYADLFVAVLLVAGRFRSVAFYMVVWGLITAASRVIYGGSGQYCEVLIRAGNYGLPLVAAIYFVWYHKHSTRAQQAEQSPRAE